MMSRTSFGLIILVAVTAQAQATRPAAAQAFALTNPLCSVVNFRFCDQAGAPGAAVPPPPDTGPPLATGEEADAASKPRQAATKGRSSRTKAKQPAATGQRPAPASAD